MLKAATEIEFDAIFSQHAISAVAAGKLKIRSQHPGGHEFPGLPDRVHGVVAPLGHAPRHLNRLMRFELNLPIRYDADAVLQYPPNWPSGSSTMVTLNPAHNHSLRLRLDLFPFSSTFMP